jgi:collagen type IV alpha
MVASSLRVGSPQADGHPLSPLEGHQFLQVGELLGVEGVSPQTTCPLARRWEAGPGAPRGRGWPGRKARAGPGQDQRLLRPPGSGHGPAAPDPEPPPGPVGWGHPGPPRRGGAAPPARPGAISPCRTIWRVMRGKLPGQRSEGGRHPSGLRGRVEQGHLPIPGPPPALRRPPPPAGYTARPAPAAGSRRQGLPDRTADQEEIAEGFLEHPGPGGAPSTGPSGSPFQGRSISETRFAWRK